MVLFELELRTTIIYGLEKYTDCLASRLVSVQKQYVAKGREIYVWVL